MYEDTLDNVCKNMETRLRFVLREGLVISKILSMENELLIPRLKWTIERRTGIETFKSYSLQFSANVY